MKKILILLISILLLSGCYDYTELNDLALVSAIGIDKNEENYKVTLEIILTLKDKDEKTMLISAQGKTISNAMNNALNKVDKKVFLKHLQILLINDEVAKDGIKEISNYFFRSTQITQNFNVVLTKDVTTKEILSTNTKNEPIVSDVIIGLLKNDNSIETLSKNSQFDNVYEKIYDNSSDIVLPSITIKNDKLSLDTSAYFTQDKLIDYFNTKQTTTYYLLKEDIQNSYYSTFSSSINIYSADIKFKVKNDNKLYLTLFLQAQLQSNDELVDLKDSDNIEQLQNEYENKIKKEVKQLINISIKTGSDFLEIDNTYYKKYPNLFNNNIYKELDYKITVDVKLNQNGEAFEVAK